MDKLYVVRVSGLGRYGSHPAFSLDAAASAFDFCAEVDELLRAVRANYARMEQLDCTSCGRKMPFPVQFPPKGLRTKLSKQKWSYGILLKWCNFNFCDRTGDKASFRP